MRAQVRTRTHAAQSTMQAAGRATCGSRRDPQTAPSTNGLQLQRLAGPVATRKRLHLPAACRPSGLRVQKLPANGSVYRRRAGRATCGSRSYPQTAPFTVRRGRARATRCNMRAPQTEQPYTSSWYAKTLSFTNLTFTFALGFSQVKGIIFRTFFIFTYIRSPSYDMLRTSRLELARRR